MFAITAAHRCWYNGYRQVVNDTKIKSSRTNRTYGHDHRAAQQGSAVKRKVRHQAPCSQSKKISWKFRCLLFRILPPLPYKLADLFRVHG